MKKYLSFLMAPIAFWVGIAWAGNEASPYQRLSNTRSLKCTFSTVIQASWKSGELSTKTESESWDVNLDNIDLKSGHARAIGNQGAVDVVVLITLESLSFLEVTQSGNPHLTTVFPNYKTGTDDFIAVTSRHISFLHPFPSQHHGTCKTWG